MKVTIQSNDVMSKYRGKICFDKFKENWGKIPSQKFANFQEQEREKDPDTVIEGDIQPVQFDLDSFPQSKLNILISHTIRLSDDEENKPFFFLIKAALINSHPGMKTRNAKAVVQVSKYGYNTFLEFNILPKNITKDNYLNENGDLTVDIFIQRLKHYPKIEPVSFEDLLKEEEPSDLPSEEE